VDAARAYEAKRFQAMRPLYLNAHTDLISADLPYDASSAAELRATKERIVPVQLEPSQPRRDPALIRGILLMGFGKRQCQPTVLHHENASAARGDS
jgi:hypothetical protein